MTSKRHLKKSKIKLGLGFIGVIAGLVVLARLWQTASQSVWRGNFDFSWIDQQGDSLRVYTLIPEYGRLITWVLPAEQPVETAFGAGPYQWKKVFALGALDQRGGLGLMRTSQEALGLAIKGWRVGSKTNLSWLDWLKWRYFTAFKAKQRLTLDLRGQPNWQNSTLINEHTFSQKIADESLSLALVNGNGLASVLTNHGLEVVSVESQSAPAEKTVISLKDPAKKDSATVAWLKWLLPQAEIKIADPKNQWTDVVLEVGKEYN